VLKVLLRNIQQHKLVSEAAAAALQAAHVTSLLQSVTIAQRLLLLLYGHRRHGAFCNYSKKTDDMTHFLQN
jgi:hypothetical protein